MQTPPLTDVQKKRSRTVLHALILALLPITLVVFCWKANFTGYDDPMHITENADVAQSPDWSLLKPREVSTYFPVTILSYEIDRALFSSWMPKVYGSWAPGVRLMTLLYHTLAGIVLWRVLLQLGLTELQALFVAAVFAVHPMACETVCWTSERKNALAALFGFAALRAWMEQDWAIFRFLVTPVLYALALMGKPSALGLLPVFVGYDLLGGKAGLNNQPSAPRWPRIVFATLPLIVIAAVDAQLNMKGHSVTLVTPPGGSVFTAVLTDLEILSRYVFNTLFPVALSAVYFVDPIRTLFDVRVLLYGMLLLVLFVLTIKLAANRRRALFGWIFFVGALGPSLNLIALPHVMQDRYMYLSTPGIFLIVVEVFSGIREALRRRGMFVSGVRLAVAGASVYVVLFAMLALQRGEVWASSRNIFEDAIKKQPQAGFARYALGTTYAGLSQVYAEKVEELSKSTPPQTDLIQLAKSGQEGYQRKSLEQWKVGLDKCPDVFRYNMYLNMAYDVGTEFRRIGQNDTAEKYLLLAVTAPKETIDYPMIRANAAQSLCFLRREQGRFAEAYEFANQALGLSHEDRFRVLHAKAAVELIESRHGAADDPENRKLINTAREELLSIPPASDLYDVAQNNLKNPLFTPN